MCRPHQEDRKPDEDEENDKEYRSTFQSRSPSQISLAFLRNDLPRSRIPFPISRSIAFRCLLFTGRTLRHLTILSKKVVRGFVTSPGCFGSFSSPVDSVASSSERLEHNEHQS